MFIFLLYLLIVVFTSVKARDRGRSVIGWMILTFLFSFLATLLLYILKDVKREDTFSTCHKCYGEIDKRASLCPHCRSEVIHNIALSLESSKT